MQERKPWIPPGWPWELEILTLVFLLAALIIPYYIHISDSGPIAGADSLIRESGTASSSGRAVALKLLDQQGVLWAVGIVGLYLLHYVMAGGALEYLSTPFAHLISPLVFSMIAYYRIHMVAVQKGKEVALATGSWVQIALWALAVLVITLVVARIRMARHLLYFREVKWDVVTPTKMDSSFFGLLAQLHPLLYMPRVYRACDQGMLIEGWFYIMVIPYSLVQSMGAVNQASTAASGQYFATSAHNLVRMELFDNSQPVFISPADRDGLLKYAAHQITRLRKGTSPGDASKTRSTHASGIKA